MKCNRCGKEIGESEIFCSDCKKYLKKFSSRSDVDMLEELIENQKNLNDLENTKELVNLDKLAKEELEKEKIDENQIQEETQIFEAIKDIKNIEEVKEEKVEEIPKKEKKNRKKIIIIISVVASILIIVSILLFVFLGKNKKEEIEVVIDYEKVINTYGNYITDIVNDYINENKDIPTWQYVTQKLDYDRYEVECSIHNIYKNGSVYLSGCKVNDKKVKYTYGLELEEEKEGKKINIYKQDYDGFTVYSEYSSNSSHLVGTITCKTEECDYVNAYDKYVLVKEESEYYLYDYTNDSINFGPFTFNSEIDVLENNNTLYGILYKEGNINNIYNVVDGKTLKNIKGSLLLKDMGFDPTIMYKYNYVILVNNGTNEFVNLKTGNVSYTIKENIVSFIENNKIVYIKASTSNNKYKIYNSNGKTLFDGNEYSDFIVGSNILLISTETNFRVYDNSLKLKLTSKNYDQILGIYEDFIVAVQDTNIIILTIEDKVLATFENAWDKNNNKFYNNLSGKSNDKITLVVENKKIPYGTQGNCIEYYYILSNQTSGFIEKTGIY